jgi:hypothetical protein
MTGRRAIVGLCLLSALLVSAFAAQSASAATKGTTVFTCSKEAAVKDFAKEHCVTGDPGTKEYGHVAVAENTTTHITITNAKTNAATTGPESQVLKATIAGSPIELVSTEVHGTGGLRNKKEASGEHYIHGHEIVLTYSNVVVNGFPECEVYNTKGGVKGAKGVVQTNKLTGTTAGKGASIVFSPEVGTVFAEFHVTGVGCPFAKSPEVLKLSVVGTITCKPTHPSGATITCNHEEVTNAKTLRLQSALGPVAGLNGKVTVLGSGEKEPEGTTKPLSVTTVETA